MRVITTKTRAYSAKELKRKKDKTAFNYALEKHRESIGQDSYTSDEMMDSLKGLCEAAGVKMRDWNLGAYNSGNNLRVEMGDAGELTGARALAWVENNITGPLRAPRGLRPVKETDKVLSHGTHNTRYNVENGRPVRRWTAPGTVPECPFTGMCYDMDFLEDLIKSVRDGRTIKEAFEDLADLFAKMLESEYEYRGEEAQFLDSADANGWEFREDGRMI